jgi:hypothetical protein
MIRGYLCSKAFRTKLVSHDRDCASDAYGADFVFRLGSVGVPVFVFNSLQTPTERSEHTGFMNLLKGTH